MIKSAVLYSDECQAIVDVYECNSSMHNSDYWYHPDIENTKREIKSHYKKIQNFICIYCRNTFQVNHSAAWDIEHIVSRAESPHFMFIPKNLCISCKDCNGEKGDKPVLKNRRRKTYPKNAEDFKIFHPHFDRYEDHIAVFINKVYSAKTEKGRKTIEYCGLLRFTFESVGWSGIVGQIPDVLDIAQRMLEAENQAERDKLKMELLLITQIQLSNTLLHDKK